MKNLVISGVLAIALAQCAAAQTLCPTDLVDTSWRNGIQGPVLKAETWDPDGPGPAPARLVVCGKFAAVDGRPALQVAAWDGAEWTPMDMPQNSSYAFDLATLNEHLFVAKHEGILRWDEDRWIEHPLPPGAWPVRNIAGIGGYLYLASNSAVHRWDGDIWETTGVGILPDSLSALGTFGGAVVAGGFDGVSILLNNVWTPLGTIDGSVRDLHESGGLLYAAVVSQNPAHYVQSWDGTDWHALGVGLFAIPGSGTLVGGHAVATLNGQVHLAGRFSVGNTTNIARRTPLGWQPVDGGVWGPSGLIVSMQTAGYTLLEHRGELVVGGDFGMAGERVSPGLARWTGVAWLNPFEGFIAAGGHQLLGAKELQGALFAFGRIRASGDSGVGDGITRWNGADWDAMPGLSNQYPHFGFVQDAIEYHGGILAGGQFQVGGQPARLASWGGTEWLLFEPQPPAADILLPHAHGPIALRRDGYPTPDAHQLTGGEWAPMPGLSGRIFAGAIVNGEAVLVGEVLGQGRVWRWSGSVWEVLATANERISAIAEYGSGFVVTGQFSEIAGIPADGIASWGGQLWSALPATVEGFPAQFWTPRAVGGTLYAAATFYDPLIRRGYARFEGGSDWEEFLPAWGNILGSGREHLYLDIVTPAGGAGGYLAGLSSYGPAAPSCTADCDCSASLTPADLTCFLERFTAGDPRANCDRSAAAPVLNTADFTCFLRLFAAGCP